MHEKKRFLHFRSKVTLTFRPLDLRYASLFTVVQLCVSTK